MSRFKSNIAFVDMASHPYSFEGVVAGFVRWLYGDTNQARDNQARHVSHTAMSALAGAAERDSSATIATIKEAQLGNGNAFGKLVERYQQCIGTQMRRFSRDKRICEELTHDVFVEAYLGIQNFRFDAPFLHWLRRIAVRVGYRYWKAEKRGMAIGSLEESQSLETAQIRIDQSTAASDAAEYVHWLLSLLVPSDRLILTVIYLDGCSIKEAAFRCGWTVTGTKLRLFRARKKMAAVMDRYD